MIDGIRPGLACRPKLLPADLSRNGATAMDTGTYCPHHNLCWITGGSVDDLKVLGAVLMSELASGQVSAVGARMRGRHPRWQARNLQSRGSVGSWHACRGQAAA